MIDLITTTVFDHLIIFKIMIPYYLFFIIFIHNKIKCYMYSVSTKTGKCKHWMVRHNRRTIKQTSVQMKGIIKKDTLQWCLWSNLLFEYISDIKLISRARKEGCVDSRLVTNFRLELLGGWRVFFYSEIKKEKNIQIFKIIYLDFKKIYNSF